VILDSIRLQIGIVRALAFRDQRERISKSPFGAPGLLLEPLLFVVIILILRLLLRVREIEFMSPVLWLASGFVVYYLFTKIAIKALTGIARSQRLADLRRIRPLDFLIAGAVVELQIYGTCLFFVVLAVSLFQWQIPVADPGAAVLLFLLVAVTALGVGLTSLIVGHRFKVFKFVVEVVIKQLLLWTSGLFYVPAMLPDNARALLLWNPLLHGIELFRHAMQPTYPIPGISLSYLLIWAFVSLGFSMLSYGNNEQLLAADEPRDES